MSTPTHPAKEYFAVDDLIPADPGPMPELGEPGADPRETWKRIVVDGYAVDYEISDYGRIVNPQGQLRSPGRPGGDTGPIYINFPVDGKVRNFRVDKLVLDMFVMSEPDGSVPLHRNGDLADCRAVNLYWGVKGTTPMPLPQPAAEETPPAPKPKARKKRAAPTKKDDTLKVSRVYARGGMQVTVDEQGRSTLNKKTNLTTADMAALVEIADAVVKMNTVMKL